MYFCGRKIPELIRAQKILYLFFGLKNTGIKIPELFGQLRYISVPGLSTYYGS